jgi:ribosomal protein L14E/L6E/L27E
MQGNLVPGGLVVSTAGRDKGKFYLVLKECPDNKVNIVDGEVRKVAGPKRKNRKHLKTYPAIAPEISEKLKAGQKVTDLDVRRALAQLIANYT